MLALFRNGLLIVLHESPNILLIHFSCLISSGNGIGDACENDKDGDGTPDNMDVCPEDPSIQKTDFSDFMEVMLEKSRTVHPVWKVSNNVSAYFTDQTDAEWNELIS